MLRLVLIEDQPAREEEDRRWVADPSYRASRLVLQAWVMEPRDPVGVPEDMILLRKEVDDVHTDLRILKAQHPCSDPVSRGDMVSGVEPGQQPSFSPFFSSSRSPL